MNLPDGTLTRLGWRARPANHTPRALAPRARPGVELHHSVGTYGAATAAAWARAMQADHLSRPGWAEVWYALGVWTDGTPVELRGVLYRSAPTDALTVCLAGNYDTRRPTADQLDTVQAIRAEAHAVGVPLALSWHGQRAAVGCPGRHVIAWARNAPDPTTPAPNPDLEDDMTEPERQLLIDTAAAVARIERRIGSRAEDRSTVLDDTGRLRNGVRQLANEIGLPIEYDLPDHPNVRT